MAQWTARDIPDQAGRTVVVTGASSGIGLVTARVLAARGARVVLACRDVAKGEAVSPPGDVEVRRLDLADLASVRAFADTLPDDAIDVLVNNAGVMAVPHRRTVDGFELQFGTNHLGHFALTGLLLDRIRDRVVTVSSVTHRIGRIVMDDLNWERRRYLRWPAYGQSKLANLLFTYELNRRLTASGSAVRAYAAHPGYANTNLHSHSESLFGHLMVLAGRAVGQSAELAAQPSLYAATMPNLPGGTYVGPGGPMEIRGAPKIVGSARAARDPRVAAMLWDRSERLTGVETA
ncbi:oxidoreductase [Actinophytocola gossypii]|uniref:SDR family NAD(P)-dependent oxidoreductase n=1 Tax=Actinophytocola gossypii TaxID=2812003 RepID=A0ABT2JGK2_9PSEU|nr:oxidoreductase [Actinophytocola gossypii]MCT2587001.1 SDR family NAD(P)-dependent oxidoreductase [Actinophytocola gossypii]